MHKERTDMSKVQTTDLFQWMAEEAEECKEAFMSGNDQAALDEFFDVFGVLYYASLRFERHAKRLAFRTWKEKQLNRGRHTPAMLNKLAKDLMSIDPTRRGAVDSGYVKRSQR